MFSAPSASSTTRWGCTSCTRCSACPACSSGSSFSSASASAPRSPSPSPPSSSASPSPPSTTSPSAWSGPYAAAAPRSPGSASSLIVKHVQLRHNIVGNDLLRAIALPLVFLHLPIVPLTDDIFRIPTWFREAGPVGLGLLLFTCGIAWALEWTYLLVMQYTSPMTMQVLGHVKTMLIIVSGIVLFHAPTSPKSALGIAVAMLGAVAYTWLKAAPAETGYSRQLCKDYLCPMLAAASVFGVVGLARFSARGDALTPAG
eukprot:TRINITY_DN4644_c0_g1_i1.p2 TRINITY_DN4644_c0_g1~~TRINITY_DN4644_c0_g1_i1.p2  ORF type:complete len:258 (-),score=46.62 TRINITY_DN4644_c0_g1_i1:310-1083(-)